jgi:uncharacterized membrane protein YadS
VCSRSIFAALVVFCFTPWASPPLALAARKGLTLTLFLIGAGLSKSTIKQVGFKPVLQGVLLWALISAGSLAALRSL